jgi:hypothetical protein
MGIEHAVHEVALDRPLVGGEAVVARRLTAAKLESVPAPSVVPTAVSALQPRPYSATPGSNAGLGLRPSCIQRENAREKAI